MRNLLGRLNARTPDELGRIAAAWHVPVSGGDKLGQVAQLYRVLTDPRAVRDMWARLPADEQALVALLALGEETPRSLAELARELGRPEAEVRQSAVRLYTKGIIAREGDTDPIPVGMAPRLLMPRELALQFQRVRDEIDAGDVSTTPLRTLLSLLDDRDIEESAEAWGIRVIPGLRTRDELTRGLLKQVGEPHRLDEVRAKLSNDAAAIWNAVSAAPAGQPVALGDALAAAGIVADDPRQTARAQAALAALEEALLVWHTYRGDGSRWLFIPAEIRSPRPASASPADLPKPAPVPEELPPAKHPHAVAWDLLTLLRALSPPQAHRIHDLNDAPKSWLRRLNEGLWNRGVEFPPAGYLDFLIDLARVEGLIIGGDAAVEEAFQVNPLVRLWRDRSFAEQTSRLRATWFASATWIEGAERDDVDVWGADWPGFRLKLLSQLAQLDPGAVYPIDAVTDWLAGRDPDMLGATFQVATARNTEDVADDAASRRAAMAEVALVTLETGFAWFGLVELVRPPKPPRLLHFTETGAALAKGEAIPAEPPAAKPALTLSTEGEIRIAAPSPLLVWSVSAFADLIELGSVSRYHLTEGSIARALQAGFELRQVEAFLTNQAGAPLPAGLMEQIRGWSQEVQRVRITRLLRFTPDDATRLDDLARLLEQAGRPVQRAGGDLLIGMEEAVDLTAAEAALLSRLRDAGFTPHGPATPRAGAAARRPPEPKPRPREFKQTDVSRKNDRGVAANRQPPRKVARLLEPRGR